jgi:hypothetical protein
VPVHTLLLIATGLILGAAAICAFAPDICDWCRLRFGRWRSGGRRDI